MKLSDLGLQCLGGFSWLFQFPHCLLVYLDSRQLWQHLCVLSLPRSLGSAKRGLTTPTGLLPVSLCSSQLKSVPGATWFLPLWSETHSELQAANFRLHPWHHLSSSPFPPPGLLPLAYLQMFQCANLSDKFVCWAVITPLLSYNCSNCWHFKERDPGDLSFHHSSNIYYYISAFWL